MALQTVTVLVFTSMQLAQGQGMEGVMDTHVRFYGAVSGLGTQEAKEQCCTYLMKILVSE